MFASIPSKLNKLADISLKHAAINLNDIKKPTDLAKTLR